VLLKIFELELLFSFFSCHTGSACTVDCGWQNARVCGQAIVSFCFGSRGLKQVRVSVLLFLAWRNGCVHTVWLSCLGCRKTERYLALEYPLLRQRVCMDYGWLSLVSTTRVSFPIYWRSPSKGAHCFRPYHKRSILVWLVNHIVHHALTHHKLNAELFQHWATIERIKWLSGTYESLELPLYLFVLDDTSRA
jgi:hypothetical protein